MPDDLPPASPLPSSPGVQPGSSSPTMSGPSPLTKSNTKKILLGITIVVGGLVTVGLFIAGLAVLAGTVGFFSYVNTCTERHAAAAKLAQQAEARMKKMQIDGQSPTLVVGDVRSASGEDFGCSSYVPSVDASFQISEPSVSVAHEHVLADLKAQTKQSYTFWPSLDLGTNKFTALDEDVATPDGMRYKIVYFFKLPGYFNSPPSISCYRTHTLPECKDSAIIEANHLLDQPVQNIRVSI